MLWALKPSFPSFFLLTKVHCIPTVLGTVLIAGDTAVNLHGVCPLVGEEDNKYNK